MPSGRDVAARLLVCLLLAQRPSLAPAARHVETRAAKSTLKLPCDIYAAAKTPCVAAHAITRALYANYGGPLYVLKRTSDGALHAITPVEPGGPANAKDHDDFCAGSFCKIHRIVDQSGRGNHLDTAPGGGSVPTADRAVDASRESLVVYGGSKVYAAYFEGGMGYRNDNTSGVAVGDEPESMYMVTSGDHFNNGCCFDYGNAETDNNDDGAGTMEAIYWGNVNIWGSGEGVKGPWVMGDLENGLFAGNHTRQQPGNKPLDGLRFVAAMVKGRSGNHWAIKGGDATRAGALQYMFEGPRPPGYEVMKKQGAILLGIGGDNSNWSVGTFYEGAMTSSYASDATEERVFQSIVEAKYQIAPTTSRRRANSVV